MIGFNNFERYIKDRIRERSERFFQQIHRFLAKNVEIFKILVKNYEKRYLLMVGQIYHSQGAFFSNKCFLDVLGTLNYSE